VGEPAAACLRESLRPRMSPAGGSALKNGSISSWIRPQETRMAQYRLTQPSQDRTVVRRSDHRVVRQCLGGDEGGGHGLVPLVLLGAFESGPVESLLFGVAGEHAEAHGLARVDGDPVEPVGGGLA